MSRPLRHVVILLALLVSAIASAAGPTYYKHMRVTPRPQRGAHIQPTFGKAWADPRFRTAQATRDEQAAAWTEDLLESVRPASAPSRLDSVFATDTPGLWTGLQEPRFLAVLAPFDPRRVATFDARHYETAYQLVFNGLGTTRPRAKALLFARARAAAEKYWTAPATGRQARPEILLGGGARYVGPASLP